jgi:ferredoxin-NADP reductase
MWLNGKIIKIADQSPTTKQFWIQVPDVECIDFRAGQFVIMDLPIHEKRLKRWRSYSIANAPDGTNVLEFSIVKLDGGLGTTYLFEEAKVGTEIKFKKPAGVFTLPADVSDENLVFICTGTGVAPFRAMVFDLLQQKKSFKSLHLIFGTRMEEGVLYREEFEKLAAERADFSYDVALSREESDNFYKGYIHQIYQEKYKKKREDVKFYLCGWSQMVDEAVANLTEEIGFDKSQVVFELYG